MEVKYNKDNLKFYTAGNPFFLDGEFLNGTKPDKFSYNPGTGLFLVNFSDKHSDSIDRHGGGQAFEDFVRGLYFQEQGIIYLRNTAEYEQDRAADSRRLKAARRALESLGLPKNVQVFEGIDKAPPEVRRLLKGT